MQIRILAFLVLVWGYGWAAETSALAQLLINGAGATFPYPLYSKWFDQYAKVDPSVRFNYQSIGSGGGQKQILEQTLDFGATDGPMSEANLARVSGKLLHIPTVAGAVVVAFNLPGISQLQLDGPTIAAIFLGKITRWDDPRIGRLNPDLSLPAMDLIVVHRSDGSGTSYIFTGYLSEVSLSWAEQVGHHTSVKWPAGVGAKGNEGVAGQVRQLPGAIAYMELVYAHQNQLPFAQIENRAGKFVSASVESVAAALWAAEVPEDFRFSMVNSPAPAAYPISGATWLLVYERQKDPVKGRKLVEFLEWALTQGEQMAAGLDYAALPPALRARVLERIKTIRY